MYAQAHATEVAARRDAEARAEARRALQDAYNWRDDLSADSAARTGSDQGSSDQGSGR